MGDLFERLRAAHPGEPWDRLAPEAAGRFERLAGASPLYGRLLEQRPAWLFWLEDPVNLGPDPGFQALLDSWVAFRTEQGDPPRDAPAYLDLLRQFRRKSSMRVAYRDINGLADSPGTVKDLSRLAEVCLRECVSLAREQWTRKMGEPWDEATDTPARFCVLALGKLGGRELNFSSDVDLIYLYEGEGRTRREGQPTSTANSELFHRVGESVTQMLNHRGAHGFLFRADLRLRPGGALAPLVPSLDAVENYYAATGQTWERLALLKARPVAGDMPLGAELLDDLHSFRYPRHPPPSLLAEVSAMKLRTEREVVGDDALERDVKSGLGGIREVEFIAQALQLLHAGRYPFLQTNSTVEALHQLVRYHLLEPADALFLEEAYWFLRSVEHRLQMQEEQQTHDLPAEPAERTRIARSLGFASLEAFDARVGEVRAGVRRHYSTLFQEAGAEPAGAHDPWWSFFADGHAAPEVAGRLAAWFGPDADARRDLQLFVRGSDSLPLMRDQVQRFADLVPALERVIPRLARPRDTLQRISAFGERYGSRSQFLATCTMNPQFFEILALLFDRSRFIHELLARHPEIFDEVLRPEILRKRKDMPGRLRELADHPFEPEAGSTEWLWLYVRAEQVRGAIGQLLEFLDDADLEAELTALADAVLLDLVARVPGAGRMAVVALGKFGGGELTFGSDLDLVFLSDPGEVVAREKAVHAIRRRLSGGPGRDPTYALDLRLRPHGDAGPLVPDVGAFRAYFRQSAQVWERQVLTRARIVGGPPDLTRAWEEFLADTVYAQPLTDAEAAELWRMRLRVQNERDVVAPRERAFKTWAGGIVDIEFGLQILQLRFGSDHPAIRVPNTRHGWRALGAAGLVPPETVEGICRHLRHLKQIEWCLRRDRNRAVSVIPAGADEQHALARWTGFADWDAFLAAHAGHMADTRRLIAGALEGIVPVAALESGR